MAAQPWWLVATSTYNGKPWNVITFEGSQADARGEGLAVVGGPFTTLSALESWARAHGVKYINDPAASSGNPLTGVGDSLRQGANSAAGAVGLGSLSTINAFIGRLSSGALWLRVGEALLGLVLIGVGLAHITGAGKIAGKVAGAVALA